MEQAYTLAKKVTVALLKKHKAAWKEKNQNLAVNDDSVGYDYTHEGSPTTWEHSCEGEGGEPEGPCRKRRYSIEGDTSDNEESNLPAHCAVPSGSGHHFRPVNVTVILGLGRGQGHREMTNREIFFRRPLGPEQKGLPSLPLSSTLMGGSH